MAVADVREVNRTSTASPPPPSPHQTTSPFPPRILAAALVLSIECLAYTRLPHHRFSLHLAITALIVFCVTLCFFARPQLLAAHLDDTPISPAFALLHAGAIAIAVAETLTFARLFPPRSLTPFAPRMIAVEAAWCATVILVVLTLAATLFPLRRLVTALGRSSWLIATLITAAVIPVRAFVDTLWDTTHSRIGLALQTATFDGVQLILRLVYPNVISIPAHKAIGTPAFKIVISGNCSGIEGLVLMLCFTIGWLVYTRRELRLARALLLVPLALGITWLLNLARIAALIAIGNAGHPKVAINGFHSEAGWILFNATALLFLLGAEHIPWIRNPQSPVESLPARATPHLYDRNLAAPYLLPFLAVLATSLLTRAASSGFESFYPVRFAVALATLFWFRADYRRLNWRFGWLGPVAGIAIFAFWLPLAHLNGIGATPSPLAFQLSQLPAPQRIAWITIRALAAVLTVPIAEELAFRGYLARRIQSSNIDSIPFANLSLAAILISSIAFGALHGSMWIAGILSGLVFALVAKFRNRLGEAVAAHATANLLITLWVLTHHDYSLW
jgi:exosortase E/protease (VPEID-CTERM system)